MNWIDHIVQFSEKNPSAIVATFGIIVALLQFWIGQRRNRMEATFKVLEMLQSKDARDARFKASLILESAQKSGFPSLLPDERSLLSSISSQFGFIGALTRKNRIYVDIFFESFANSTITNYERLEPYFKWRQERRPIENGNFLSSYRHLVEKAEWFILIRSEKNFWKRLLIRLRMLKPDSKALEILRSVARGNT